MHWSNLVGPTIGSSPLTSSDDCETLDMLRRIACLERLTNPNNGSNKMPTSKGDGHGRDIGVLILALNHECGNAIFGRFFLEASHLFQWRRHETRSDDSLNTTIDSSVQGQ